MSVTPEQVRQLLNSEDFGDRLRGSNQLRQLDPVIAYELVQIAIADSSARVRYNAVSQMGTLGNQDLAKTLEVLRDRLQNDPEADVQSAAADALGALKLTEAFSDLQHAYQNTTEWLVQFSIIATLGELGDPRGFELLKDALNSREELIQTAAIGSLGELGDPRAIPLLTPYTSSSDWQIRFRAEQALEHLGVQKPSSS